MSLMSSVRQRGAWLCALPLFACAQVDPNASAPPGQRVVLTTAIEWPSAAEVVDRAARLSGVRVREPLQIAPRRYRMTLECTDDAACRAAMARIAADRQFVLAVDADGRMQIPAKPSREMSR
jgi:hypothetical protein